MYIQIVCTMQTAQCLLRNAIIVLGMEGKIFFIMKKKIDLVDKQVNVLVEMWREGLDLKQSSYVKTSTPPSVARGSLTLTLNEQVDRLEYGRDFSFVVIYVNCACFSQFLRSGI